MADKNQLIRISFQTDTSGLNAATSAASAAQAATDQLRASTAKLGTDAQSANAKYKSSIAQVKVELDRQRALVELTNRSDTKLLNERILKYRQLKSEVDKFNKSLDDTNSKTKGATQSFGQLFTAVKIFLTAGIVKQTLDLALDMAKLSGNVDGVSRAFNRLPNATLLLSSLRDATHGTVGDLELMQKALQANNFRIPLENLGTLFEFAATKAQQTGQEVNHLVDYIVSGIGYRSIKRLDDLGFTANRVKEALGGVSLQAASMGQVMTAVTKLMEEDLGRTGGYAETAATKVGQLETKWQELKITVSQAITQDGGFIDYLNEILEKTREILNPGIRREDAVTKGAVDIVKEFQKTLGPDAQKNIEDTQQKLNSLVQVVGHYNDAINKSASTYKELNIGAGEYLPSLEKLAKIYGRENEVGNIGLVLTSKQIALRKELNATRLQDLENTELQIKNLVRERDTFAAAIPLIKEYMKALASPEVVEDLGLIEAKMEEIEAKADAIKTAKSRAEIERLTVDLQMLQGELADLKALGDTKITVEGVLVPVDDPKIKTFKYQTTNKIGVLEVKVKPVLDVPKADMTAIFGRTETDKFIKATGDLLRIQQVSGGDFEFKIKVGTTSFDKELADALAGKNIGKPIIVPVKPGYQPSEWEKVWSEIEEHKEDFIELGLQTANDAIRQGLQNEVDSYDERIKNLRDFYDEQQLLAGNNEKAKSEMRLKEQRELKTLMQKRAEAEKQAILGGILANTALGIIKAIATSSDIYEGLAQAAYVAIEGATQYAIASSARYYAKGAVNIDGPGTTTSDSIPAFLSKGESVIPADKTQRSLKLLDQIHAGKIDDRVLDKLHIGRNGIIVKPNDNSDIVNAVRRIPKQDVVRIASDLYEVEKMADGFSQRLRKRTLSK